jgi:hypothetical protein
VTDVVITKHEFGMLAVLLKELIKERDEARREVCNWSVGVGLKATSQEVAKERGWDCFEKEDK